MLKLLKPLSLALCLAALAVPVLVQAQPQTRAYAPENLRTLSYNDQVRVISLEYSEQSNGQRIPDDQLRFYIDQVNRSNWTFSRIKADISQSLAGGGGIGPQPGGTIRCESTDGRVRTCRTGWPGYSRLIKQLSKTPCTEGSTWQSRDGNIFVSGGCRGEFGPGQGPQPPVGRTVRCESTDNRPQTCSVPWYGRTRMSRQLSSSACIEGRTWQSQNGQVWVTQGCRADFVGDAQVLPPPQPGRRVTCSSVNNRTTTCALPVGNTMPRLLRQISKQPCIQGRTWGIDSRNAIWVNQGCRGEFGN